MASPGGQVWRVGFDGPHLTEADYANPTAITSGKRPKPTKPA